MREALGIGQGRSREGPGASMLEGAEGLGLLELGDLRARVVPRLRFILGWCDLPTIHHRHRSWQRGIVVRDRCRCRWREHHRLQGRLCLTECRLRLAEFHHPNASNTVHRVWLLQGVAMSR